MILSIHESESGGREGPWKTVNYPPPPLLPSFHYSFVISDCTFWSILPMCKWVERPSSSFFYRIRIWDNPTYEDRIVRERGGMDNYKYFRCIWTSDSLVSIGSSLFTISQVINNRRLTVPLLSVSLSLSRSSSIYLFRSTSGQEEISIVDISSSIQFSPPPFQIQLEFHDLHRKFISDTSMVLF